MNGLVLFLTNELINLSNEVRKKHPSIKESAEQLIYKLRSAQAANESTNNEQQFTEDLRKIPDLLLTFQLTCKTNDPKLINIALSCLQQLIMSRAIPSESFKDIINILKDSLSAGFEIQLKVLQVLLSFFTVFTEVYGDDLYNALFICIDINNSKNPIVTNTATATLNQLIVSIFEKVSKEDKQKEKGTIIETENLEIKGEYNEIQIIQISKFSKDAYLIFRDLCLIINNEKPVCFKSDAAIPKLVALELIERILKIHYDLFKTHIELRNIIKEKVCHFIINNITEKNDFPSTLRKIGILSIFFNHFMPFMVMECEILLSMILKILESDANPIWYRVMLMEILQDTCANDQIIKFIYVNYDYEDSSLNLFQDLIRVFNRITTSYKQSNIISNLISQQKQRQGIDIQSSIIGSSEFSLKICKPNIRCIERYEKSDPPYIHDNYIIYLAIKCILSIISSLTKNIKPLIDNEEKIELNEKSLINNVYVVHEMANAAWSGILASFSFLFTINTDDEIFDDVLKGFSQFTIICAVLKLNTPRNAFLTLLCKSTIPIESSSKQNESSLNKNNISMNSRNLKCLQALLDISKIIFNNFDDVTWYLILDTLQASNTLLYGSKVGGRLQITSSNSASISNINSKLAILPTAIGSSSGVSVETNDQLSYSAQLETQFNDLTVALDQFFENTQLLEENAFNDFLNALSRMVCDSSGLAINDISNLSSKVNLDGYSFSISKLRYVILLNIKKVVSQESMNIWDLVMQRLIDTVHKPNLNITIRKEICNAINDILASAIQNIDYKNEQSEIKILEPLKLLMKVRSQEFEENDILSDTENQNSWIIDVQKSCLETLNNILQTSGQNFVNGWSQIFSIINRVLINSIKLNKEGHKLSSSNYQFHKNASLSLIRMVFPCLQLICSDFLSLLNPKDFYTCIETIALFGNQIEDLNISLTAIGLSWNLSDYLQTHKQESIQLIETQKDEEKEMEKEKEKEKEKENVEIKIQTKNETIEYSKLKEIWNTEKSQLIILKDTEEYENLVHKETCEVIDSLWMLLLKKLSELCSDERPEVRTSAIQTLFRTITMNGNQLSLHLWVEWIFCILFPLLKQLDELYEASIKEEEQKEKQKELKYGKKRRSTLSINPMIKHWDETRSYTINSVIQCFKDYFDIIKNFGEGFDLAWNKFLDFIYNWIINSSQDVCISGLNSVKGFVELPENENFDKNSNNDNNDNNDNNHDIINKPQSINSISASSALSLPHASLISFKEKLLDIWKLCINIGDTIVQSANKYIEDNDHPERLTSIYGSYTEQVLNAYVSVFPILYVSIHEKLELYDFQNLFNILTNIILYHTYPVLGTRVLTYIGDKETMYPFQSGVTKLLDLIIQDFKEGKFDTIKEEAIHFILSKLILYVKFFVWEDESVLVSYHAKRYSSDNEEEESEDDSETEKLNIPYQYSYIAFSYRILTIIKEFFVYIKNESYLYNHEDYIDLLKALSIPMKLKYNCPKPESQKKCNNVWRSATDAFNDYAIHGLEFIKNQEISEKQKYNICETIINSIIDYFSNSSSCNITPEEYTEFEEYDKENLNTFEKEFMLCLCEINLSKETMAKYVKLIKEGSDLTNNILQNNNNADDRNQLTDEQKALKNNTRKIFSSLCLNSLFDICDDNNTGSSSSNNASEMVAPVLLNICEITIKNYVKDFTYKPADSIPIYRTTELDNILDHLYKLNFKENLLNINDNKTQYPYRKDLLSGKTAHLFYLHSSLIECIGLTDKSILNKIKLCLTRIGQELGL
ncbi:hypothetical protein BCR32DRAFT_271491 [Anaeromyces robustus]|uniref:Protein MON2 homolog n=1 Tax=Anaeromyces robustus TaxID=1754192 RepID=A0A1Y1WSH4_9FUNG|nr:hypothetical protein BCR32DRAFT_271491 [Anaeromyces robustus]|eukprot:ORX76084.1 hypothetical protein BCR32DRAFT_271491 [Anaeromyces robustus]